MVEPQNFPPNACVLHQSPFQMMRVSDRSFLCLKCALVEKVDLNDFVELKSECEDMQAQWDSIYAEAKGLLMRDRSDDPKLVFDLANLLMREP